VEAVKKISPILLVSILLAIYLVVRFFCTKWLDSLGGYSSYYFEVILVTISLVLLRQKVKEMFTLSQSLYYYSAAALACGYLVFKGAGSLQIGLPFDLSSKELLFFLLIVAPILEELIFRFFCWQPLAKINKSLALLTTSLLFSYSHFHSFWFVPTEYQGFIYYQTAYTLILGLACGYAIWRYNSLLGAILIHFAFNFGFLLGSII